VCQDLAPLRQDKQFHLHQSKAKNLIKNFISISGLFLVGLFFSTVESSAQWTAINSTPLNPAVLSFAIIPNGAGGSYLFAATDDGVFRSTDSGIHWTASGLPTGGYVPFAVITDGAGSTNLITVNQKGEFFLSTYDGTSWSSWTTINSTSISHIIFFTLAISRSKTGNINLFAGTWGSGIFLSTYNGTSWSNLSPIDSGLTHKKVNALAVTAASDSLGDSNLFAATEGGGVFLSTNNGTSWSPVNSGLTDTSIFALAVSGSNLFAGTYLGHVFLTTNNGTSWTKLGSPNTYVTSFAVSPNGTDGTNLFAGTFGGGVFLSTNNGTSWTAVNSYIMNPYIWTLALMPDGMGGTYLLAGTEGGGAWRRPLSEMIPTTVDNIKNYLPSKFSLEQNYPNPFNPTTVISFSVATYGYTSLCVYDLLGHEVATLVSETLPVGTYTRQWNAINQASGIYFYRLQGGSFTETKKLVLLR
jgi:hypothetical protein